MKPFFIFFLLFPFSTLLAQKYDIELYSPSTDKISLLSLAGDELVIADLFKSKIEQFNQEIDPIENLSLSDRQRIYANNKELYNHIIEDYNKAIALSKTGVYDDAIENFERVIQKFSVLDRDIFADLAKLNIAYCYFRLGESGQAQKYLRLVDDDASYALPIMLYKGHLYNFMEDFNNAKKLYIKSIKNDSFVIDAYENLIRLYRSALGNPAKADQARKELNAYKQDHEAFSDEGMPLGEWK